MKIDEFHVKHVERIESFVRTNTRLPFHAILYDGKKESVHLLLMDTEQERLRSLKSVITSYDIFCNITFESWIESREGKRFGEMAVVLSFSSRKQRCTCLLIGDDGSIVKEERNSNFSSCYSEIQSLLKNKTSAASY